MRFLFTCGGTAGHINPAIAVAGRLRELMPESEFLFLGAEDKMEMQLVPREGYEIRPLPITNISRGHSAEALLHNAKTLANVARSMEKTDRVLREFKPDAVIGTGGYVCYPVLRQAAKRGIPTLVHESNAVPGLTTKLLDGHVDRVMVGFEESRAHYKHPERVVVTGTPVRGDFAHYTRDSARAQLGLPKDEPLVVSVWGSLGAGQSLNTVWAAPAHVPVETGWLSTAGSGWSGAGGCWADREPTPVRAAFGVGLHGGASCTVPEAA